METKSKKTWRATHPGTILKYELEERGITQKAFAELIGMQKSHVSELIKGKRSMTKAIANKIEAKLGISAISLINLQTKYDYDVKKSEKTEVISKSATQMKLYNEMLELKTKLDLILMQYEEYLQKGI